MSGLCLTTAAAPNAHQKTKKNEICRFDIDISVLSAIRLADKGSLQELGAGFTLFSSGKPATQRRFSGVGVMVRNSIASKLETSPTYHSTYIMFMRLPLKSNQNLTLLTVYASNLQVNHEVKNSFYYGLRRHFNNTPANDKVILIGDINASGGRD